jgi:hypothetical protein
MLKKLNVVAGLFQLKGIEAKLSHDLAKAIYEVVKEINPQTVLDLNSISKEVLSNFRASFGEPFLKIGDLYPEKQTLFKNEDTEYFFRKIQILITAEGQAPALEVSPNNLLYVLFPLNRILAILNHDGDLISNFQVDFKKIYEGIRSIVSHELRHAADYLLNKNNLESQGFGQDSFNPAIKDVKEQNHKYFNNPTEMKSYAGDVAKKLYSFFEGDIGRFRDTGLLNHLLNKYKAWVYLYPENKKKFLQRVYSEFQRMLYSGYGKEDIKPGKIKDYYLKLREVAKKFKKAKDFANFMVPYWEQIKEDYESVSNKRLLHYTEKNKYKSTKAEYASYYKAYSELIAGKDPESLPEQDIPNKYKI